jgi:NAD(P)-dependent dehydrogenase (short-subunit alcohol dehydrogenase family)
VLEDRRIVVTGASSGIGRGLCVAYAEQGAKVWAVGRGRDRLAATVGAAAPGRVETVVADLTSGAGPARVGDALGGGAPVDVVVHAAGLLGPTDTRLVDYPDPEWEAVFAANVTAVQRLHRVLAPHLEASANPVVIGVSSTVGREPRAGWGMYSISKHAVEAWLGILDLEWQGRVYSVNPGATRTPMRAAAVPDEDPTTLPTPQDIAPIFLRLAHPACPEPSGSRFDARDWIGVDPFEGLGDSA